MNSQQQPNNLDLENEGNFRKLIRVITLSHGEFSLILLRCNYTFFQEQIFSKLQEVETVKKIHLLPNIKTIYTNIADQLTYQLDHEPPSALMVFGLESVQNIDAVLTATNQAREEFRNNFNFPVFFWVNDAVLRKIIRLAPDFKNWATTIEFKPPSHQLINFIQQETDKIFDSDITNFLFAYFCQELATAKQDLQQRGENLDPAINASLEYVFGYRDYLDDNLDSALEHYQQSLIFWQESNNLDRQGTLLVNLGLIYYRKASINQIDNQNSWEQARNYFEQSLEIFKQTKNQDLLSQYITLLCEVYLKSQAWDDLEQLVNESLEIHQQQNNYLLFLAKDYGFLAELALCKSNFQEGKNHAETALQILHDIQSPLPNPLLRGEGTGNNDHKASLLVGEGTGDNDHKASLLQGERFLHIPKNEQVYYQFLLAKSYHGLGEISKSIEILETAKTNTQIGYNPQLYIDILNQLNLLYFQQEEYLTAFYTKQEKLQIEQQYGFRAFVGASYLNPQRKIIQSVNSDKENTDEIAQEIVASGREEYVKRLRSKIAEDRCRLIVIHGQSGVGKSSILQAGLIPALEQETIKAKQVLPILLRAYTNWLGELAKALNVETIHELFLRSTDEIIKKLAENSTNNLLTVLIFDQFEEFFFVNQEQTERQAFYDFLRRCLITNDVKIVLSLREDYLHYLLELERKFANEKDTDIVNNTDILSKYIRYYLGNFSSTDATTVFTSLTKRTKDPLQKDLIDTLVAELAGNIGEIRPIELQIVGTQLENQKITTLEEYLQVGNKEKLVAGFLENVIQDCGTEENKELANLVLYLLTDENIRPLKTYSELAEELKILDKNTDNLEDALKILVASGLVLLIPEFPENRYQLVHDYLVEFIRKQYKDDLLDNYAKAKAELELSKQNELLAAEKLKKEQEARQLVEDAKIEADKQIQEGEKRLKLSSGLAVGFVVIAGIASVYAMKQLRETNVAKQKQTELQAKTQDLASQTQDLAKKSQAAEKNKQTAENNFKLAEQNTKKARENLLAAKTKLEAVNKQAETLKQKNTEAELKVKTANDNIKTAETKSQQAKIQQQQAENKAKEARETFKTANAALKKAETAKQAALKAQQEALIVTKLEQGGVNVLRQFQLEELPSLVSAVQNGKTLKTIVKNKTLDKYPTISPIYALNNILDNISNRNIFKGHQGTVNSVSFSPDGKTIATASSDNTARLWNLQGQLIQ
ncbi:hypothetical protein MEO41_22370, partial [Dolichospermum sp. ST_sed4]|nr:hypothetical protein [Dolichospermum sp. ST_sed4]